MVLSKDELISSVQNEVRILQHLISKAEPEKLDYRPTPNQRSLRELLQYLTIVGPIHARAVKAGVIDMPNWGKEWNAEEAAAKERSLDDIKTSITQQSSWLTELLTGLSEEDYSSEIELFNSKGSRGLWMVRLVLLHLTAYRMQLFLYLKGAGREELNTLNLWVGMDAPMPKGQAN